MPRPKSLLPIRKLTLHLPEDLMARLDLILLAESTGRVPFGAYSTFFSERIREFLDALSTKESS